VGAPLSQLDKTSFVQSQCLPLLSGGLFDILLQSVSVHSDATVLNHDGVRFTYKQALARTLSLVEVLSAHGIGRGDRVGLYFPNHFDFLAAFFAVSALGATVVPINPLLKAEEIGHVLADSQAVALISHSKFLTGDAAKASEAEKEVRATLESLASLKTLFLLCAAAQESSQNGPYKIVSLTEQSLDDGMQRWLPQLHSVTALTLSAQENALDVEKELALIVYTSGTTGKPKGAMLSFANILTAVTIYPERLDVNKSDRIAAVLPLCHLYGLIVVLLGTIKQGATMVMLEQFEAAKLAALIESERITVLPAVPTMYQFLSLELDRAPRSLNSLRLGMCGGSAMPVELMKKLESQLNIPILEGWALTECSVIATLNPVELRKCGSVGIPLPGLEVAILDKYGKQLPSGAENIGELCCRGKNVMQGYLGKPEATAETIQNNWLHTGDLGYCDIDGYLYVVGRSKEMIIRGGMNIYPREVEAVLLRLDSVREAAVIGVPDQYMGERVKAFVVLKEDAATTDHELKAFCSKHMADYKVPRIIEFVESIPKNSTGKVLKRLLS